MCRSERMRGNVHIWWDVSQNSGGGGSLGVGEVGGGLLQYLMMQAILINK